MSDSLGIFPPVLTLWGTLLRWIVICSVSAAPSFWLGYQSIGQTQVLAMLAGIAVFIAFYTALDFGTRHWALRKNKWVRGSLAFGYSTRFFVSFIPPVFLWTDGWIGMYSIRLVEFLMAVPEPMQFEQVAPSAVGFYQVFLTTIVQGLFLNVILAIWIAVTGALAWVAWQVIEPQQPWSKPAGTPKPGGSKAASGIAKPSTPDPDALDSGQRPE